MKTRIQNSSSISNTTYHSRCRSDGQRNWWLMRDDGMFVDIGEHRGDRTLDVTVELEPGVYTLGSGPRGKFGVRENITVKDDRIRVSDRMYDLAVNAETGFVELFVPMPQQVAGADDVDAAMDQWVLDHVDTRGLVVCGCIAARIDVDRQGNMCRMNKGVDTIRAIRVSLCGPMQYHPGVNAAAMARELVR